ncbi:hypothetical protein KAR91_22240 [Candidatus Pacearchaeota archaeon]|nr:hypothetical protein [Candidatus Pacearchaeota archaeon]
MKFTDFLLHASIVIGAFMLLRSHWCSLFPHRYTTTGVASRTADSKHATAYLICERCTKSLTVGITMGANEEAE